MKKILILLLLTTIVNNSCIYEGDTRGMLKCWNSTGEQVYVDISYLYGDHYISTTMKGSFEEFLLFPEQHYLVEAWWEVCYRDIWGNEWIDFYYVKDRFYLYENGIYSVYFENDLKKSTLTKEEDAKILKGHKATTEEMKRIEELKKQR